MDLPVNPFINAQKMRGRFNEQSVCLQRRDFRRLTGSTWLLSVWRAVFRAYQRLSQMVARTLRRKKKKLIKCMLKKKRKSLWAYGPARPTCHVTLCWCVVTHVKWSKISFSHCIRHTLRCRSLLSLPVLFLLVQSTGNPRAPFCTCAVPLLLTRTRLLNNNRCSVLAFCNFI